jgi:hypothetical protein
MTKADRSDITILLDRSGSMASVKSDVEGGFARLLEEQRRVPGECALSLVQFDSEGIEPVYTARPIGEAPALALHPRGMTPLLDAVGQTIVATGERLAGMPESERPGRVLFVIITDGLENASREYSKAQVKHLVERQRGRYSWQFLYLGANVDAFAEAGAMGIAQSHAALCVASPAGVSDMFAMASHKLAEHRDGRDLDFSDAERELLKRG